MGKTVKVKVTDHHFKNSLNIGGERVTETPKQVTVNKTVRNAVRAGTLELVEGSLAPEKDEKSFRGDDDGGEEGEEAVAEEVDESPGEDDSRDLSDLTVDELRDLCEENGLKKSGRKKELVNRLGDAGVSVDED